MRPVRRFEVRPAIPEALSALPAGHEPALGVGPRALVGCSSGSGRAGAPSRRTRRDMVAHHAPERWAARRRPGVVARPRRRQGRLRRRAHRADAGSAPAPTRRSARRLLLPRVRHHRGAAAVLRRPRRARRRPPEGVARSRRAARRRRPALHRGLLPPAPQRRRLAGGALPAPRPRVGSALDDTGVDGHRRPRRRPGRASAVWQVDVGRVPLYLLDTDVEGNSPDGVAITDRLYGGDASTACARRSCSASAACGRCARSASTRRCSTPTRATPASSASSGSASTWPPG